MVYALNVWSLMLGSSMQLKLDFPMLSTGQRTFRSILATSPRLALSPAKSDPLWEIQTTGWQDDEQDVEWKVR